MQTTITPYYSESRYARPFDSIVKYAPLLTRADLGQILTDCIDSARQAPKADAFFLKAAREDATACQEASNDDEAIRRATSCFKHCVYVISNAIPGAIETHQKEHEERQKQIAIITRVVTNHPDWLTFNVKRPYSY